MEKLSPRQNSRVNFNNSYAYSHHNGNGNFMSMRNTQKLAGQHFDNEQFHRNQQNITPINQSGFFGIHSSLIKSKKMSRFDSFKDFSSFAPEDLRAANEVLDMPLNY